MTEAEWLAATDPEAMLKHALAQGVAVRKLRVYAVACCELLDGKITPEARTAVEAMARLADGEDTDKDRRRLADCGPPQAWPEWAIGQGSRRRRGAKDIRPDMVALARDIFGNPFRPVVFDPAWRTDTVMSLAQGMYESRDFSAMPILADALQDAGCDADALLAHCRDESVNHVRGCWALDLVLGKE